MKIGELLKQTAIKGGPAAIALALGQPEIAATLAAASIAGDGVKFAGKRIEDRTGWRPHKVAAPAAAVLAGLGAVQAINPDISSQVCEQVTRLCADPKAVATLPGLAMVLWQVIASGVFKVAPADEG